MEETKTRIKNIYDMMALMDEAGKDMTKVVACAVDIGKVIGREIGLAEAARKAEEDENRDPQ